MYVGCRDPVSVMTLLFPSLHGYFVFVLFFLLLKIPLVLDTKGVIRPKKPIVLKVVPRAQANPEK